MEILIVEPDQKLQEKYQEIIKKIEKDAIFTITTSGYNTLISLRQRKFDLILMEIYLSDIRGDLLIDFAENQCFKVGMTGLIGTYSIRIKFDEFLLKPINEDDFQRIFTNLRFRKAISIDSFKGILF